MRALSPGDTGDKNNMTDTLYYDSHCPLCDKEVARLRDLSGGELELRDIHTVDESGLPSRDRLLRTLHLRTGDGKLLQGLEANVAAWQHTRFGFLWRWLQWPLIRVVAGRVYDAWALWRYQRLYGEK